MKKRACLSVVLLLSVAPFLLLLVPVAGGSPRNSSGRNSGSPLVVSGVSPNTGPAAGGTTVTIIGAGFQPSASVAFGGVAAAAATYVSSTELQVTTPAHAAGTVDVVVTQNPHNQSATLASGFTYTNGLTVTWVTPSSGPVAGGTTVAITGTGFQAGATVAFGSVGATGVTVTSSTQISAVTPGGSAGTVGITVTNPDTQTATLAGAFTYSDSLAITGVSPVQGPVSGGTVVAITGVSFSSSASVTFGGVAAAGVTYISSTELQATTSAHAAGTVDVVVNQNPHNQSVTLTGGFTYIDPLTVTDLSPAIGPVGGGTVVSLKGTGFQAGATVTFGSVQSTAVAVVSSTQINVTSPPESSSTVAVTVTNPDGQSASLPSAFTYTTAPVLYSVSPNSGPVTGGTSVTIWGGGFESGTSVTFGGVAAASVTFMSGGELQAVTPAGTAGTVSVVVTNPDSQIGTLEAAFAFFHTVSLSWMASASGDVVGYNVYRSLTPGGPYTRLNFVALIPGTTFTDNNVQPGQTLFYVTTAVSSSGGESDYSNEARVTVPSP